MLKDTLQWTCCVPTQVQKHFCKASCMCSRHGTAQLVCTRKAPEAAAAQWTGFLGCSSGDEASEAERCFAMEAHCQETRLVIQWDLN